MDELVNLNVGGSTFATTLTTLCSAGGTLGAMFGGGLQPTLLKDSAGRFFIDRDGTHFGKILNYLRDGTVPLPETREALLQLRAEADYFNLEALAQEIDAADDATMNARSASAAAKADAKAKARADICAAVARVCQQGTRQICKAEPADFGLLLTPMCQSLEFEILRVLNASLTVAAHAD